MFFILLLHLIYFFSKGYVADGCGNAMIAIQTSTFYKTKLIYKLHYKIFTDEVVGVDQCPSREGGGGGAPIQGQSIKGGAPT